MKTLLIIASLLFTASLYAQKPITGAFGYKFGSSLPKEKIVHDFGNHCFSVQPEKKFRNFNMYCVNLTPITGKIYAVMLGYRTKDKDGKDEYQAALAVLENIYGKPQKKSENPFRPECMFTVGKQSITVNYSRPNFDSEMVIILYIDQDLYNKAQAEKKQLEIKKTDASML